MSALKGGIQSADTAVKVVCPVDRQVAALATRWVLYRYACSRCCIAGPCEQGVCHVGRRVAAEHAKWFFTFFKQTMDRSAEPLSTGHRNSSLEDTGIIRDSLPRTYVLYA